MKKAWLKSYKTKFNLCVGLFWVYVLVGYFIGAILLASNIFLRQELQTINSRYDARPWLLWTSESLKRLNPFVLWQYHEAHEIPRKCWAWDFTLSWLVENNHPRVANRFVLFNHLLEDEPPAYAIEHYPWMEPLRQFPLPRNTIAEMITVIAKAGARMIIIDSDFPQYTDGDRQLANAIHNIASGRKTGRPVPVLMATTVNRRSSANVLELEVPTKPSGVLEELSKLSPNTDVTNNFTGITSALPDEDQVVRRLALRLPGLAGPDHDSLVLKAVRMLGIKQMDAYPNVLEIDFVAPPNSELYPVRSLSYLLDPKRKAQLFKPERGSADVNLNGAIVVLGDSVVDVFSTPLTNQDASQMSGAEILVQAIDTICRGSKLIRLQGGFSLAYLLFVIVSGGITWSLWKSCWKVASRNDHPLGNLAGDILVLLLILASNYVIACLLFTYYGLIVPLFVPSLALGVGALAAVFWEREREREEHFARELQAAQDKLTLAQEKYEAHLKRQEAEALTRQMILDRQRRKEFVRRLNHDLNAPVSVLNWTLAELMEEHNQRHNQAGGFSSDVKEKLGRLVKNSDKLCELIDQIVTTYDYELTDDDVLNQEKCDLTEVLSDCLDLLTPLSKAQRSFINWSLPQGPIWFYANGLELARVVDNLVRNALKHNPSGTNVTVQLISSENSHFLTVKDNGKGIAPKDLEHIFEPGYKVELYNANGQGLGLDIVYGIITKLGGTVSVESTIGQGTVFTVVLPKYAKKQASEEEQVGERHGIVPTKHG